MARRRIIKTKIKSVSFRANVALDVKFNHVHIEASADVPEGTRPEDVVDDLKLWVSKELKRAKEGEVLPQPVGRFRV